MPADPIPAEQAVLGSMMMDVRVADEMIRMLTSPDFYRPAHSIIFETITALRQDGHPCDPVAVLDPLLRAGRAGLMGGAPYLHACYASVTSAASAGYYARQIVEYARLRKLEEIGTRIAQMATQDTAESEEALAFAERQFDEVRASRLQEQAEDVLSFAERVLGSTEPVIPGLLSAMERAIVVAPEGVGKSVLATQVWLATAAGRHIFAGERQPPKRALLCDLENPEQLVQRRARSLLELARREPGWDPERARIIARPGGMNLRNPRDQGALSAMIEEARPDLLIIGPVWKMLNDQGERAEQLAGELTRFLDRLRARYGIALWLEHHSPLPQNGQRDMRPVGSGVWLRWPEYGIALRPSRDPNDAAGTLVVSKFRGDRVDSVWPAKLVRATGWPWDGIYPTGTFGA